MNTIIIYESTHHGNTKKLADAIASKYGIEVIDIMSAAEMNLEQYDIIGLASGICFGKFYEKITAFAREKLTADKQVFFLYSCAKNDKDFAADIRQIAMDRGCYILGTYGCKGFNTYGPLKIVGGMNKHHPNQEEMDGAVAFYEDCMKKAERY